VQVVQVEVVGVQPPKRLLDGEPHVFWSAVDNFVAMENETKLARKEDLAALSCTLEPEFAMSTADTKKIMRNLPLAKNILVVTIYISSVPIFTATLVDCIEKLNEWIYHQILVGVQYIVLTLKRSSSGRGGP
jgi:hypothetical protein